jgi:hypothetical protein
MTEARSQIAFEELGLSTALKRYRLRVRRTSGNMPGLRTR